ncbi:hypothetical protein [Sphingomonas oryzagri]|uniref:TnsA endonuclease N-terminal domain-containing protein n=1 Tax=Sphingomonas oryzagri TaxID=3042314 RepID=A0ABT6N4B8_9SPHN|nr:hypothetical protein [Sphingomonas oryzagri]MDH7639958.1 hypothetical protein [Sphingomonas oryzagri]
MRTPTINPLNRTPVGAGPDEPPTAALPALAGFLPRLSEIGIPDPLDCLHPRARRIGGVNHVHPLFSEIAMGATRAAASTAGWTLVSIESRPFRSCVTFHRKRGTFQFLSRKTCAYQSGESPWERLDAMEREVDPGCVDYATQGLVVTWETPEGRRRYTLDCLETRTCGGTVARELKASASYFSDVDYAPLMERAANDLPLHGIAFVKRTGDEIQKRRRRVRNVARAFDDRFTGFDERQLAAAADHVEKCGPEVPLALMGEVLGVHRSAALQVVNALMCARHYAYDLDVAVNDDTIVSPVPPAEPAEHDLRRIAIRPGR